MSECTTPERETPTAYTIDTSPAAVARRIMAHRGLSRSRAVRNLREIDTLARELAALVVEFVEEHTGPGSSRAGGCGCRFCRWLSGAYSEGLPSHREFFADLAAMGRVIENTLVCTTQHMEPW